jgi:hypothetical protein
MGWQSTLNKFNKSTRSQLRGNYKTLLASTVPQFKLSVRSLFDHTLGCLNVTDFNSDAERAESMFADEFREGTRWMRQLYKDKGPCSTLNLSTRLAHHRVVSHARSQKAESLGLLYSSRHIRNRDPHRKQPPRRVGVDLSS